VGGTHAVPISRENERGRRRGGHGGLCQNRETRGEGRWGPARATCGGGEGGSGTAALKPGGVRRHQPGRGGRGQRCSAQYRGSEGR
jgi:hypothetical protein